VAAVSKWLQRAGSFTNKYSPQRRWHPPLACAPHDPAKCVIDDSELAVLPRSQACVKRLKACFSVVPVAKPDG
jgi:hypothetical protein